MMTARAIARQHSEGVHVTALRPAPWAQRFTIGAMVVYVGKISDVFPWVAPLPLGKLFISLAILALVLEGGSGREGILRHPLIMPFIGLVGLAVISVPFGIWPGGSFEYLTNIMLKDVIFAFLLIFTTRTRADLTRVLWAFVVCVLVLDYALLHYGYAGLAPTALGRNEVAMFSVIALGLALGLEAKGLFRIVKWVAIPVTTIAVFASLSRGSYLGMAVVVAAYFYFRLGRKIAVAFALFLLFAYAVYVNLPAEYRGSVDSIVNYEEDYNTTAPEGRIEVWKRGLAIVAANPVTGVGVGNFAVAEGAMHQHVQGQPWLTAHNSPLQVAGEVGLVGLILYLILVVRLFRGTRFLSRQTDEAGRNIGVALYLALIGYAVTGFFLSQGIALIFYIMIAFVFSAMRLAAISVETNTEGAIAPVKRTGTGDRSRS